MDGENSPERDKQTSDQVVDELIEGRRKVYGNPEEVFLQHAEVWTGILKPLLKDGAKLEPHHIPLLLIAYKLVRAGTTPDYSDNIDDVFGYADIFKLVVGDDMVVARSVDDYLKIKLEREKIKKSSTYGQESVITPEEAVVKFDGGPRESAKSLSRRLNNQLEEGSDSLSYAEVLRVAEYRRELLRKAKVYGV